MRVKFIRASTTGHGDAKLPYLQHQVGRGAMVQTASTSKAEQSHVPGATAIRVLGTLLILLGGYRLYVMTSSVVPWLAQEEVYLGAFVGLFVGGVLGLLIFVAGVLLVRLDRAGRAFGLVVCLVVLALEVLGSGLAVVAFRVLTSSPAGSPGLLFWLLHFLNIVVFLVGIILIARWHPPRKIKSEQLGRIFD